VVVSQQFRDSYFDCGWHQFAVKLHSADCGEKDRNLVKGAKSPSRPTRTVHGARVALPDPRDREAFEVWLTLKPWTWSLVIAARVALRVLPLVESEKLSAAFTESVILPLFRATAIARFAAVCPNRTIAARAAAAAASRAAGTALASIAPSDVAAHVVAAATDAAAAAARRPAADVIAATIRATLAARAAARGTAAQFGGAATSASVEDDISPLVNGRTPAQLGHAKLWSIHTGDLSPQALDMWFAMSRRLLTRGNHWQVWIDWYDDVLIGSPPAVQRSEAWEMAFTDVEESLPWDSGAAAVNGEIATRLRRLNEVAVSSDKPLAKETVLAELADVASPQPTLTDDGRLDAGANPTYDRPTVDDDLSTLPVRQCRLISVILSDLPKNAPAHVTSCLRGYDEELKIRGIQPILGLLKDMADIVAVAVAAPRAEDEWLEPGVRKAFDRFAENHAVVVRHFPLDPKREEIFARIPLNAEMAVGNRLTQPFESVATASAGARQAGLTTDDFVVVVEKMTEFARVLATQPTPAPTPPQTPIPKSSAMPAEIHVEPADRPQPVTVKKRSILSALGFFERAYNLAGTSATLAGTPQGQGIITALKEAIAALWKFIS
jgi:hypothetical protein